MMETEPSPASTPPPTSTARPAGGVWRALREDASWSATIAAGVTVLVGMTSSAVLVFQAARAAGMTAADASSWLGALCVSMGVLTIALSLRYRTPVLLAWSTAGSAMLVTGVEGLSLSEIVGAFLFSAILIFLSGATGLFARVMDKIPLSLANALLAGVLVNFCFGAFGAVRTQPVLVGAMFAAYLLAKRFRPRWTMLAVVVAGVVAAAVDGTLHFETVKVTTTRWHGAWPAFSWTAILAVGVPLYVVTMASQNLTGITVIRANGYSAPISRILGWTGVANAAAAPFGGFALNFAAITAAICMGPECHPQPKKRYFAAVVAGVIYTIIGFFAGTVTSIFAAFPVEMTVAIAGFALISTVATALQSSLAREQDREAAFATFAIAASGLSFLGVGSAFWAVVAGGVVQLALSGRRA